MTGAKQSWQGASLEEVTRIWGPPTSSVALADGRESRTWLSEIRHARTSIYPSIGVGVGSGNVGVGVGIGGAGMPVGEDIERCERTLVFSGGQVSEQTWTGTEAYCATFRR